MKKQLLSNTLALLLVLSSYCEAQNVLTFYKPVKKDYGHYISKNFYQDFELRYLSQLSFVFKKDNLVVKNGGDAKDYWQTNGTSYAILTFINTDYGGYDIQCFLVMKDRSEHILGYSHARIPIFSNETQLSGYIGVITSNIYKPGFKTTNEVRLEYEELTLGLKPNSFEGGYALKGGKGNSQIQNLLFPVQFEPDVFYAARICNRLLNYLEAHVGDNYIDPIELNNYGAAINLAKFEHIVDKYPFTYQALVASKELANQLYQKRGTPKYKEHEADSLNKLMEDFKHLTDTVWLSGLEKYAWKRHTRHYTVLSGRFYKVVDYYFDNKCNALKKLMQARLVENCYSDAMVICMKILECDEGYARKYLKIIDEKMYYQRDSLFKQIDRVVKEAITIDYKSIGDEYRIDWGERIEQFKNQTFYTVTEPKLNLTLSKGIEYNAMRNLPTYVYSIKTDSDKFTIRIMQGFEDLKLHHSNNNYGMGEYRLYNKTEHIDAVANVIGPIERDFNIDMNDTSRVIKKIIANTDGAKFKSRFKAKDLDGKFNIVKAETLKGIYEYDELPENNEGWNAKLGAHRIDEWTKGLEKRGILFTEIPELRQWQTISPELRGVEVVLVIKRKIENNIARKQLEEKGKKAGE